MANKRFKIISFSIIIILVSTVAAVIVFKELYLPELIEKKLSQEFEKVGLSDVAVDIDKLSPWQAKLKQFSLGKKKRFFIREIEVNYSPESLMRQYIHSIKISGVAANVIFKDGHWDLGPLTNFRPVGDSSIPFKEIRIEESVLTIELENHKYKIPVNAIIRETDENNYLLELDGLFQDTPMVLIGNFDSKISELIGSFKLKKLQSNELYQILNLFIEFPNFDSEGSLDLTGNFEITKTDWKTETKVVSDQLILTPAFEGFPLPIFLTNLNAFLNLSKKNQALVDINSNLNQSPFTAIANINLQTQNGHIEFTIDDLEINKFEKIFNEHVPVPIKIDGKINGRGFSKFNRAGGSVETIFQIDQLAISSEIQNRNLQIISDSMKINVDFHFEPFQVSNAIVTIQNMELSDTSSGVSFSDISMTVPYSFSKQEIKQGNFNIQSVAYKGIQFPGITGILNAKYNRLDLQGSGIIAEDENLSFSGWVDWNKKDPTAEFQATIPDLTLNPDAPWNELLREYTEYEFDGVARVDADIKIKKGNLLSTIDLAIKDVVAYNSHSETELQGINGLVKITDLFPLTSEIDQSLIIGSIQSGNFKPTNGNILFDINNTDSVTIKQVEFDWLGGKLFCQNTKVNLANNFIRFDLKIEGLDLQEILDFIEYDGVRGQGKIYGQLPIMLEWGENNRITFGDGFLIANPNKGVLQISEENARTILGITEDIDPQSADLEETVSLMVFEALQDMEYTKLEIIFKNDEIEGLMTTIQAQGHGPRGDEQNQIPIGGLNVNINNLDELINSLIYSNMSAGNIKLK